MISAIRKRVTYANVMATIAVFLALGGVGVAAKGLKKNSVGPKQLKAGAVREQKLAPNAVTETKLAPNAVTASKLAPNSVTESGLAPNSVDASKVKDGSIGIEKAANSLHQNCRAGTTYVIGGCMETAPRGAQMWNDALSACLSAGGSLPSIEQLALFIGQGNAISPFEWTNIPISATLAVIVNDGGAPSYNGNKAGTLPFRCVFSPTT